MPGPTALRLAALLPLGGDLDLRAAVHLTALLEEAGFAALLLDDDPAGPVLEPLTLLSALASVTERIGLVAPLPDEAPYTVARKLASLDHVSGGRAGWHVPADADARTAELVDVVQALWDATEDGAMVRDKASGVYVDPRRRRAIEHSGEHFRVAGPLTIGPSPQRRPVLFRTGSPRAGAPGDVFVPDDGTAGPPGGAQVWPLLVPGGGAPEALAERMTAPHATGGVDGFTVALPAEPSAAERFVTAMLPVLRDRGVRLPPPPGTLRERLGLSTAPEVPA